MKTLSFSLAKKLLCLISLVSVLSCSKEADEMLLQEGQFKVEFSLRLPHAKIAAADSIDQILITLTDEAGQAVLDHFKVNVYQIADQFTTDPITLKEGTYQLTKFGVLSGNEILYATPLKESKYAYLVNDPLPIAFTIQKNNQTALGLEVLSTRQVDPINFGFVSFNFGIVNPLAFHVKCYAYDLSQERYISSIAKLDVIADGNQFIHLTLGDTINTIWLRPDIYAYKFIFEREGFAKVEATYLANELVQKQDSVFNIYLDLPPTVNVYSQQLLYAPLQNQSSKTFLDAKSGSTYSLSQLLEDTTLQQKIDLGYFYGIENGPSLASLHAYPVSVYDIHWSHKNATQFKKTSITPAEYLEYHLEPSFVEQAFDNTTASSNIGRAIHLGEGEVIAFQLDQKRSGNKGLILIKRINGMTGLNDYIEFETAIVE